MAVKLRRSNVSKSKDALQVKIPFPHRPGGLRILLFVQPDGFSQLIGKQIVRPHYKIVVQNAAKSIKLQGLEIKNYCEIPLNKIKKKFFFIIREI